MKKKNDTALTYTCGLIEFIGRRVHRRRGEVVERLGSRAIERVYQCTDVLCADSIDRVADEYVAIAGIEPGDDDNVGTCHYEVPGHWVIMQVFERLILDVDDGQLIDTLHEVYASQMCDAISDYNSDLFMQSRDYLRACYLAGDLLDD